MNLLDIDQFGDQKYVILDFEKGSRSRRERISFELSRDIRRRVTVTQQKEDEESVKKEDPKPKESPANSKENLDIIKEIRKKKGQILKVEQILNFVNAQIADMVAKGE